MPATPVPADPARCPLCGAANGCAMEIQRATGRKQEACWCLQVDFSAELLAEVPPASANLACICAGCAGYPAAA